MLFLKSLILSYYDASATLMSCKNENLSNLYMFRCMSCIDSYISYVVASQRFDALIHISRPLFVAAKARYAKVRLH